MRIDKILKGVVKKSTFEREIGAVLKKEARMICPELLGGAKKAAQKAGKASTGAKKTTAKASKRTGLLGETVQTAQRRVGSAKNSVLEILEHKPVKGKTSFQVQMEEERQIDSIIERELSKDPAYKKFMEKRKASYLEFDPDASPEELARQMAKYRRRYYEREFMKEAKLEPEERKLIEDYINKHKEETYFFASDNPISTYMDMQEGLQSNRARVISEVRWAIRANLGNNGLAQHEEEIVAKFQQNEFKVLANEDLRTVQDFICGTNKTGDDLLKLLRFDFTKMAERNINEVAGRGASTKIKTEFLLATDEEYAIMAKRAVTRAHRLDSYDFNKWKSIMDMSDAEFEAFEIIGDKIPEKYIVTNSVHMAQLLRQDEAFVINMAKQGRSQEDIAQLLKLNKKFPKLAKNFAMQEETYFWEKGKPRYNVKTIEQLCKIFEEDKKAAAYILRGMKSKGFLGSRNVDVEKLVQARKQNPELFKRLISLKIINWHNKPENLLSEEGVVSMMNLSKKAPELVEAIITLPKKSLKNVSSWDMDNLLKLLSENNFEMLPYVKKYMLQDLKSGKIGIRDVKHFMKALKVSKTNTLKLLKMMKSKHYPDISYSDLENLSKLMESDGQLIRQLLSLRSNGNPRFYAYELSDIIPLIKEDKNLFISLMKETQLNSKMPRYNAGDIKTIYELLKEDARYSLDLLKKTKLDSSGKPEYAFNPASIKNILKYRSSLNGKMLNYFDRLMSLTVKDKNGAEHLYLDSIEMDVILSKLENGEHAEIIEKFLNQNGKGFLKFLAKQGDLSKDEQVIQRIAQFANKDLKDVKINFEEFTGNKYVLLKYPEEKIRVFFDEHHNYLATEQVKISDSKHYITKTNADGSRIVQELDGITPKDSPAYIPKSMISTHYDSNGNITYTESVSEIKGTFAHNAHSQRFAQDGTLSSASIQTDFYGSKNQGMKTVREFTTPQGAKTSYTLISGPKGHKMTYVIKDKDGNVTSNIVRTFRQIGENHYRSSLNGQVYDIVHKGKQVIVSKLDSSGNPFETITLSSKVLDPALSDLYKKLPGDMFFTIRQIGLKRIGLPRTKKLKAEIYGNACFTKDKKIYLSNELKDNPFVFSHELGHAIDYAGFKGYSSSPQLNGIYRSEIGAFRNQATTDEARIIEYFTPGQEIKKASAAIIKKPQLEKGKSEGFAEGYALSSGFINTSYEYLGLRSISLQQNLAESLSNILNRIY